MSLRRFIKRLLFTMLTVPTLWAVCFMTRDAGHIGIAVVFFLLASAMLTYRLTGFAVAAAHAGLFQRFPEGSVAVATVAPLAAVWLTVLRAPTFG